MSKDYNYIAKVEQEITKKYGKEAVVNPKSNWNDEKEKQFAKELSEHHKRLLKKNEKQTKEDLGGFKVSKKLLNKESVPFCSVCSKQTRSVKDDVMIVKYDCCNACYIKWVEGREERWQTGWRPNE